MSDAFDLHGRTALVTGGSRGLGREIARGLADRGATVVIASRKLDACRAAAEEIAAETGTECVAVSCHVGRWHECERLVATTYERFATLDVLVNNAGMSPVYPSLAEIDETLFDKVLAVNLKGPFRLAALIGTRMAAGAGGSIINVSSIAAVQPTPSELPYAVAKAGLHVMTDGMARAFGPCVRVNTIMAGPFMTGVTDAWDLDGFHKRAQRLIPLQRGGQPREIVGTALYLASNASSYTSGAVIKVDGGYAHAS